MKIAHTKGTLRVAFIAVSAIACAALSVPAALAHGEAKKTHVHDEPAAKAKDEHSAIHGGQFVEVEGHHGIEMVATADTLVFHLTEDHKPMDLAGASFKAVVQTEAGTRMLALAADGSTLRTAIDVALPKGAKVVLTGKDRHGHALQARFVKD